MALGFSFNKAKVLSSAEKFVQQGKLQNAIAEYDKILKEDPKDLTVLNTIGDLYARAGNNAKASEYFRRVGDAYATAGFVVKAIAMYKKLTKLTPNDSDSLLKLADLYSQQGLYSDARSQYMAIADHYMKTGQNDSAAGIFKKMLELDPENIGMQTKLADLYIKLGKKEDAKGIFFRAAQALHARGSIEAADEALDRVLKLDPRASEALAMRAQMAADSNKPEKAIASLEKISDLDSRPDALNALLSAMIHGGRLDEAEPIITKLITVHNDLSGVKSYTDALFSKGRLEDGLAFYRLYADRLLSTNSEGLVNSLQSAVGKVKDSVPALELILSLLRKANATTFINEVLELLAHACVQAGKLQKASALYQELTQLEPENPSHAQSLKQIAARMGTDSATRKLSAEESGQAFMVEELQHSAPTLQTNYPKEIASAVRAALTDSELFSSYNLPEKAIAPLESALAIAPQDPELHQQLATLYVRNGRYQDAANSCKILSRLYAEAGHHAQADQYAAMGARYEDQAGEQPAMAPPLPRLSSPGLHIEVKAEQSSTPAFTASSVGEYSFDEPLPDPVPPPPPSPPPVMEVMPAPAAPAEGGTVKELKIPRDISSAELRQLNPTPEVDVSPPPVAQPETSPDADLSGEWEDMLVVEEAGPAEPSAPGGSKTPPAEVAAAPPRVPDFEVTAQPVVDPPAGAGRSAHGGAHARAAGPKGTKEIEETIEELRFYLDQSMVPEAQIALERLTAMAPGNAAVAQSRSELQALLANQAATVPPPATVSPAAHKTGKPAPAEFSFELDVEELPPTPPPKAAPASKRKDAHRVPAVEEPVLDLGPYKPAKTTPPPTRGPDRLQPAAAMQPSMPATQPGRSAARSSTPLGDLVLDLEEALGSDFGKPAAVQAVAAPASMSVPSSSNSTATALRPARDEETASVLTDLFEEFKGEVEESSDGSEDAETHYNLGVAFKEMGLLDEAIGELQKVCHAINNGKQFSQALQAYTWLAHCLMEKGAPQAAVRWYESALKVVGIAEESRLAVYYDLASAHEAAGDRKAALDDLMKVYGSNIDYRDVAERIKVLRS